MSQAAQHIINALQIKKIVWVDDCFASAKTWRADEISTMAGQLLERAADRVATEFKINVTLENAAEIFVGKLSTADEIEKAQKLAAEVGVSPPQTKEEQTRGKLEEAFGIQVAPSSGSDWLKGLRGEDFPYANSLLLLDLDYNREGISREDQAAIIDETIKKSVALAHAYCVIVTDDATETSEVAVYDRLRQNSEVDFPKRSNFSVLGKAILSADDPVPQFVGKLREKIAAIVLTQIHLFIKASLSESVDLVEQLIAHEEMKSLIRGVLYNSYLEGVYEIDAWERMVHAQNRLLLTAKLKDRTRAEPFHDIIGRFRRLQLADTEVTEQYARHEIPVTSKLITLREAEVFTNGGLVNANHLPVIAGDIFKVGDYELDAAIENPIALPEGEKLYVLLAPQCDTQQRGDGSAGSNVGWLLQIVIYGPNQQEPTNEKHLRIGRKAEFPFGVKRIVADYRVVKTANLCALRFCAFDDFGRALLRMSGEQETVTYLPGVSRLRSQMLRTFKDVNKLADAPGYLQSAWVTFDNKADNAAKLLVKIKKARGQADEKSISYKARRLGRINELLTSEMLLKLSHFWTRIAYPHDFASGAAVEAETPSVAVNEPDVAAPQDGQ